LKIIMGLKDIVNIFRIFLQFFVISCTSWAENAPNMISKEKREQFNSVYLLTIVFVILYRFQIHESNSCLVMFSVKKKLN
jgi:hypothetical protein